jgi:hypothetical protein
MRGKDLQLRAAERHMSANEQVRIEIQSFLLALDSYPERFAQSPGISFEEHRSSLVEAAAPAPRRRVFNSR